jgi:hypothetical protein
MLVYIIFLIILISKNNYRQLTAMKNKNDSKLKKYLQIIKQIEKVRAKNNKNWMDMYRLAFSTAPEKAISIIKKILKKDIKLSGLAKKLLK